MTAWAAPSAAGERVGAPVMAADLHVQQGARAAEGPVAAAEQPAPASSVLHDEVVGRTPGICAPPSSSSAALCRLKLQ
jgi:hypothetical protein